jgi:hypothetical protein
MSTRVPVAAADNRMRIALDNNRVPSCSPRFNEPRTVVLPEVQRRARYSSVITGIVP